MTCDKRKDGKNSKKQNSVYVCNDCNKEYSSEAWFKKHQCKANPENNEPTFFISGDKKIYPCDKCGVELTTKSGRLRHKCKPERVEAHRRKLERGRVFKCDHCDKKFKTEKGLTGHRCTTMLRKEEVKTPEGRQGFFAFHAYHKMASYNSKREKTVDDYVKSSLYNSFYNFGKYIYRNEIRNMQEYLSYLHAYSVPLDDWANDKVYNMFARRVTMKETADKAVERTFSTMESWAIKNETKWYDYFRLENKNRIIHHVKMGKVSPWVIYNSRSGEEFINKLDSKDLDEIFEYINPVFWGNQFKRQSVHAVAVRQTLNEAGL